MNQDTNNSILKLLRSVGSETFIDFYPILKIDLKTKTFQFGDKFRYKGWTKNSLNTKVSKAKKIFKEGLIRETLEIITRQEKVNESIRQLALKYLSELS